MNDLISVIMLTFNRENLLSHMIECILAQTYTNFEYIIVDNGSSDRSGEIADEYAEKDSRIRVVHIEKSSIGKGRNVGLASARGKYIAFVDDDDKVEETYLEELYECVDKNEEVIAICATDKSKQNESVELQTIEAMKALLDRQCFNVGFPTKLIPSSFFDQNIFDEQSRFDDIYLMPRIIAKAKIIRYIAKPLYIVNRHEGNNSAWTTNHSLLNRDILKEYLEVYDKRTKWLCKLYPDDEKLWKYYEWSFWISMVHKITIYNLADCSDLLAELKRGLSNNKTAFLESSKIQDFEKEWMGQYIYR